jgi:glutaredoxin
MNVTILATSTCPDCKRVRDAIEDAGVVARYICMDMDQSGTDNEIAATHALATAAQAGMDISRVPIVVVGREAYTAEQAMDLLGAFD